MDNSTESNFTVDSRTSNQTIIASVIGVTLLLAVAVFFLLSYFNQLVSTDSSQD